MLNVYLKEDFNPTDLFNEDYLERGKDGSILREYITSYFKHGELYPIIQGDREKYVNGENTLKIKELEKFKLPEGFMFLGFKLKSGRNNINCKKDIAKLKRQVDRVIKEIEKFNNRVKSGENYQTNLAIKRKIFQELEDEELLEEDFPDDFVLEDYDMQDYIMEESATLNPTDQFSNLYLYKVIDSSKRAIRVHKILLDETYQKYSKNYEILGIHYGANQNITTDSINKVELFLDFFRGGPNSLFNKAQEKFCLVPPTEELIEIYEKYDRVDWDKIVKN